MLGFIRQYAKLLGLDSQIAATKYLLERGPMSGRGQRPKRLRPPVVGSRIVVRMGIGLLLLATIFYLGFQVSILAAPPPLQITQPPVDQRIGELVIEIQGETVPSASVNVNGSTVVVDESGKFSANVNLIPGLNVISIEARNRAGKIAKTERSILVDPTPDR